MICISLNISSAFGQHITTKTEPTYSDIYHLGGYLGLGVLPSELLHIHSGSSSAVIRISQDDTGEINYWDIVNSSGDFSYQFHTGSNLPAIQMLLTSNGQLALSTEPPHESVIFQADAKDNDKGILIPRLTNTQITNINTPATGLLVYNTTATTFSFYDGTQWLQITQNQDLDIYLLEETFDNHPASNITTENINTFAEIDALQINTLIYNDANGILQSIIPNGTEGQILTINETGNYIWTEPQATAETYWSHTDNYTYLKNANDNVGIGTETPQTTLHIFTQSEDYATLRLHTYAINKNSKSGTPPPTMLVQIFWDFKSEGTKLKFNYGNYINGVYNIENKFTFTKDGFLGLGTATPETNLHLATYDETQNTTLRMQKRVNSGGSKGEYESVWDMEVAGNTLEFKYAEAELNSTNPTTETMMTIVDNKVVADGFVANTLETNVVLFDGFEIKTVVDGTYFLKFYSAPPYGYDAQINFGGTEEEPAVIIDRDGNLGIGTTVPNSKHHVNGDIRIDKYSDILLNNDYNHGLGWYGNDVKKFAETEIDGPVLYGYLQGALGTTKESDKIALYWNDDGYVGIGTTTPSELLTVGDHFTVDTDGNVSATSIDFDFTEPFEISTNGNNNQTTLLSIKNIVVPDIEGEATADIDFYLWDSNCNTPQARIGVTGPTEGGPENDAGGRLVFYTTPNVENGNLSKRMIISPEGNVGIGKTNPNNKLDVAGGNICINDNNLYLRSDNKHGLGWYGGNKNFAGATINGPVLYEYSKGALGTRYTNDAENIALYWNYTGKVGIGSTNPSAQLEILNTSQSYPTLLVNSRNMDVGQYAVKIKVQGYGASTIKALAVHSVANNGYPRKVGLLIITKLQGTLKVPCNCPTLRG